MMTGDPKALYAGLDLGTSGCRLAVITTEHHPNDTPKLVYEDSHDWPEPTHRNHSNINHCTQSPSIWWETIQFLFEKLANNPDISRNINALLVDGTSSTVLMTNSDGMPLEDALMYSDNSCVLQAEMIDQYAPGNTPARGPGSSLAKWIYFAQKRKTQTRINSSFNQSNECQIAHQTDWITGKLCNNYQYSDEHNCLKLGYDSVKQCWSPWVIALLHEIAPTTKNNPTFKNNPADCTSNHHLLPIIKRPGDFIGCISKPLAKRFNLNSNLGLLAGTTDSTASFIASGASMTGDAVTSLGSSLVLKILSSRPIFDSDAGIYSHRLNDMWLVGGASNTGGAALKKIFTVEQIKAMTPLLVPEINTKLNYYPLPGIGERFPVADTSKTSNTQPRPVSDSLFFQGLLEGIARIEKLGYRKLRDLGAPILNKIITTGGGAQNKAWHIIRERILNIPVTLAVHQQAAYGAALLAFRSRKHT